MRPLALVGLGICLAATVTSARASETSDLYSDKCSTCHGDDGQGQTDMGKKFHAPNFTKAKWQAKITNEAIVHTIETGVVVDGQHRMPPWKDKLTPQQIRDLGKYVRTFGAR